MECHWQANPLDAASVSALHMSPQFPKRSTRPLTAESYRVELKKAHRLIDTISDSVTIVSSHAAHEDPNKLDPCPTCKRHALERAQLTRAIKDLAAHSARLLERHNKEQS